MPTFRSRTAFEIARGVKAFLNIEGGLTRKEAAATETADDAIRRLRRAEAQIARQQQVIENKKRRIIQLNQRMSDNTVNPGTDGIPSENLVWIFGNGRTGSTWLSRMMGEMEGHAVWFEPSVGELFGNLYYNDLRAARRRGKVFILGDQQKETWLNSIRSFVLEGANARFPQVVRRRGFLVVKEPHGSVGAPLLMEALPESRQIFLVRDPRDVVSSALNAFEKGSWGYEHRREDNLRVVQANERPDDFVRVRAESYLRGMGKAKEAYEAHEGRKSLVRYEELRSDTLSTMKRIYKDLEVSVEEEDLTQAVEKHSWENVPEKDRGEGKFHRKASPGGWREDLTTGQIEIVERITAPLLKEFYGA
ncbi:MAG: sulfotransferase [Rubrobacteraceae bacterium]